MHRQIEYALANPVFDPDTQITERNFWTIGKELGVCLTVNIGME